MTEKKVYCSIEPRCKVLKFISGTEISDLQALKNSLFLACKTDRVLDLMVRGKNIIFQQKNENDVWFDVEDDDDIMDKSNLKLIAFSNNGAGGSTSGNIFDSDNHDSNENFAAELTSSAVRTPSVMDEPNLTAGRTVLECKTVNSLILFN